MTKEPILHTIQKTWHGTLKSYLIGFFISLIMTTLSFFVVISKPFSALNTVYLVITLAMLQAMVQLIFFLHIGEEKKPRYLTYSLIFTIVILFVVVVGSIWVMSDLHMRMMPGMPIFQGFNS